MIHYLTLEEILYIHDTMVRTYGGSPGIRDLGLLESAIARPKAGFGDFEAYSSLEMKAAVLCHSLLKNHAFVDGNKRTAVTSAAMFLRENGKELSSLQGELVQFALGIASDAIDEPQIAEWLIAHCPTSET